MTIGCALADHVAHNKAVINSHWVALGTLLVVVFERHNACGV
jgi:hypothetical protein